jgi:hypothetical protein
MQVFLVEKSYMRFLAMRPIKNEKLCVRYILYNVNLRSERCAVNFFYNGGARNHHLQPMEI